MHAYRNKGESMKLNSIQHFILFCILMIHIVFSIQACESEPEITDQPFPYHTIVSDTVFNQEVRIIGEEYNNALLENCVIENIAYESNGILLRDVSNVHIKGCTIRGSRSANSIEFGILLSAEGATDNVIIEDCLIEDTYIDGIHAAQRSQEDPPVNHTNLIIRNNIIRNVSHNMNWRGHYHGMYIQAQDFLIEGNTIYDVQDGNGISVRSSGIVRGNTVYNVGSGDPIRYYNDHMYGPSDTLIIENNICYDTAWESGQTGMISLIMDFTNEDFSVSNFTIRFNTLVIMDGSPYGFYVSDGFDDKYIEVYGNLVIQPDEKYLQGMESISMIEQNYVSPSLQGFVSVQEPYDFHLTESHPANGYATRLSSFPEMDVDGETRKSSNLDAGADQLL
jgi:hypothetical protein